ncbi:hypothetical protein CNMCM6106_000808 [Aspergillus hiratsukae]|uniref:Uncharacterized protein n=1 Tax=Aspergillus hiratsukae TaxID=1194566 RepID=A0A8H6Q1W8_9EURO|nr:hypothetical protein CNMCM6106_000808 [Aspergillus hiratsukae]
MQTVSRQLVQLLPPHPNLLQRARHAQLPNNRIQNIPQIRLGGINAPITQHPAHLPVPHKKLPHPLLLLSIRPMPRIELAHSRKQDTARLAVPDPQRPKLMTYPVAGAQLHRRLARQRRHGVHGAELALQARVGLGPVMLTPQQARDEQIERVQGVLVCFFRARLRPGLWMRGPGRG